MDYQIIFRDNGDDFYIDDAGHLCLKRDGEDEAMIVDARNVDAFIQFLRDEQARLAAREVAK
jgi:hypothetical protein